VVFEFIKKRRAERAERKAQANLDAGVRQAQPALDDNDYQKGLQVGEELGAAIVGAVDEECAELGKVMIGVFTTRLAVKSVFSDDPTSVSRACIAELSEQLQGDGLKEIKAAISGRLVDWEQISREVDIHDAYEKLLADRSEGLHLKLWVRAVTIGAAVVTARNEEMGRDVTESDLLPLGREILETAREAEVSLHGGDMEPFPREVIDYIFEVTSDPPIEGVEEK
jgi:hypothetical protein